MESGSQLCCYLCPPSAERRSVNYPTALDRVQRHFKTVSTQNFYLVVTQLVRKPHKNQFQWAVLFFFKGWNSRDVKPNTSPIYHTKVKYEWNYTSTPLCSFMRSFTTSTLLYKQFHQTLRRRICHSWDIKDSIQSEIWAETIVRMRVEWEDQGIFNP